MGEFNISSNNSNSLVSSVSPVSPALTLSQLQEQGVQSIKIQNTKTNQEIQQLQEQTKLSELKQKRGKFIQKVLDDIFEENSFQVDQATIDEHYNETDEEIIKWARSLKLEQTGYLYKSEINYREELLLIPVKDNEIYQKVKKYALALDLTDLLYFLIEYPTFNYDAIRPEVEEELLRPALGSPAISEYEYSKKEIEKLQLYLSWKEEDREVNRSQSFLLL